MLLWLIKIFLGMAVVTRWYMNESFLVHFWSSQFNCYSDPEWTSSRHLCKPSIVESASLQGKAP